MCKSKAEWDKDLGVIEYPLCEFNKHYDSSCRVLSKCKCPNSADLNPQEGINIVTEPKVCEMGEYCYYGYIGCWGSFVFDECKRSLGANYQEPQTCIFTPSSQPRLTDCRVSFMPCKCKNSKGEESICSPDTPYCYYNDIGCSSTSPEQFIEKYLVSLRKCERPEVIFQYP